MDRLPVTLRVGGEKEHRCPRSAKHMPVVAPVERDTHTGSERGCKIILIILYIRIDKQVELIAACFPIPISSAHGRDRWIRIHIGSALPVRPVITRIVI